MSVTELPVSPEMVGRLEAHYREERWLIEYPNVQEIIDRLDQFDVEDLSDDELTITELAIMFKLHVRSNYRLTTF